MKHFNEYKQLNLAELSKQILEQWEKEDLFHKSIKFGIRILVKKNKQYIENIQVKVVFLCVKQLARLCLCLVM